MRRTVLMSIGIFISGGGFSPELSAQATVVATVASERVVGNSKICSYEHLGRSVGTRTIGQYQQCPYSIRVARPATSTPANVTARFVRETVTGQTKTCTYRYQANEYSHTVSRRDRCPRTIRVRRGF